VAVLVAVLLLAQHSLATPLVRAETTAPDGFRDEVLLGNLDRPTVVQFAADGRVFVAEKRGRVLVFDSTTDTSPTVFADLQSNVHNYWDRGLLGMALHPNFPSTPHVFVLYTYNHILGDPAPAPRWVDPTNPTNPNDPCPTPPGPTTDGCVVSGRLSRLTASGNAWTGAEHVLIEDWCEQFPSHSIGHLQFGPDGALYASAGDGASFTSIDYGQRGGTLPSSGDPVIPANPCGDPPGGVGVALTLPTAEGGVLRSQDIRTRGPADPVGLSGTVIRIDPGTGEAWPTNERARAGDPDANARKIIGYGLRNPFRFTIRPGSDEVWIGDVGWGTWEEVNRIVDPSTPPPNFGWPCYEGAALQDTYGHMGLDLCLSLQQSQVAAPYFAYAHAEPLAPGDSCGTGSSSITGITFLPEQTVYPAPYKGALFIADYSRRCIWSMPIGSNGLPDVSRRALFADLRRADGGGGAPIFLGS
jgi:glucose/arabinose dehydrogenase